MANVKFLQGTSANLAKYLTTATTGAQNAIEGAFYLTTDTNRLYIGKDIGSGSIRAVPVNQGVVTVASVSALPVPNSSDEFAHGQFYYAQAENVLCVLSGDSVNGKKWVQINAVNVLEDTVSNITVGTITDGFSITDTVTDSYDHSSSGSFSLIGGPNITLSKDPSSNTITITGASSNDTTYGLGAASNKIQLTTTGGTAGNAGEVSVSGTGIASVTASSNAVTVNVPAPEMTVTQNFSSAGVLTTRAHNSNSNGDDVSTEVATVTPSIKLGTNNTEYKFIGSGGSTGVATLPVYTKTEVDDAIADAKSEMDSMTYKGTAAILADLTSTSNIGDTYKASAFIENIPTGSASLTTEAHVGDLIIASKGADGAITGWDVVPSGNDQTITGYYSGTTTSVTDQEGTIIGIQVSGDQTSHIDAAASYNSTTKINTITISQREDYTAQTVSGSSENITLAKADTPGQNDDGSTEATFTAVTAIQTDSYGNVVPNSIQTKSFKVVDSHANINSVGNSVSVSNNVATIQTTVSDTDIVSRTGSYTLGTTGSIAITSSTAGRVDIDLVWGSFN